MINQTKDRAEYRSGLNWFALGDLRKLTFSIRSQIMALLKYSMLVHSMPCNKRSEGQRDNNFSIIQA